MEELPDKNLFMMCKHLNLDALSNFSKDYYIRNCRKDELDLWKSMPFDDADLAKEYHRFMTDYFKDVYSKDEDSFYKKCLFVCDKQDVPIATCLSWKAYNKINTIHWFKVRKDYEGKGIGRALLSVIMKDFKDEDYPIYLHTQPESYRAIKLYSDFGFELISDVKIGFRQNHLIECLPILKKYMPANFFDRLKLTEAPKEFLNAALSSKINQF